MKKKILSFLIGSLFAMFLSLANSASIKAQGFGSLSQFEKSLEGGATVVLGRKLVKTDYDPLVEVVNRDATLREELINDPKFTGGVKAMKLYLADKNSAALRAEVVNRVFQEVYGRDSTALEQANYDAQMKQQKQWYMVILTFERSRLQKDTKERTAMLNRAYNISMGRDARPEDLKYWLPRYEHFTQVVNASRQWLYSPAGANDLVETVTLYLNVRTGKKPNEALVKKTMTAVSTDKLIFIEMLKSGIAK
jgi:hypothetical protein